MDSILEWQSYEHSYTEHGRDWFWILGIITLAAAVLAFFFGNYIFGILILISGFTLGLMGWRKPRMVQIRITPRGIQVGDMQYPFTNFHSFWIETEHMHGQRLLLHPVSKMLPLGVIMLGEEVDPNDLAEILLEYMDEIPMRESILHRLFDYIGV